MFRTFVKTKKAVKQLTPKLNNLMPMSKWNFDLEDCDNILCVDSKTQFPDNNKTITG